MVLSGWRAEVPLNPRLPASFGLTPGAFAATVGAHLPLIVARTATVAEADTRAAQLHAWGAITTVFASDGQQRWLRRDGRVIGPLPLEALLAFAQPGDDWSKDGADAWQPWSPPGIGFAPRPAPAPSPPTRHRRNSPWLPMLIAAIVFALALVALAWHA